MAFKNVRKPHYTFRGRQIFEKLGKKNILRFTFALDIQYFHAKAIVRALNHDSKLTMIHNGMKNQLIGGE